MSILDRILLLLGNTDQKELTEYLGLKKTAFSDWKSGKSNSYRKYLIEIAKYFDVSLDYLVYGDESKFGLPNDQKDLLTLYNRLSPDYKSKIIERAETLAELEGERAAEQAKKAEKTAHSSADAQSVPQKPLPFPANPEPEQDKAEDFYIDIFNLPASAGTGVYLDNSSTEPLLIVHTDIADRANYAIRVSGDSMIPKYCDGDIVLVETCPSVEKGEIGIFVVDGEGFIKKYGGDRLISLNPKYPDMLLKKYESVYCRGRVLGKAVLIE